ncbi:MAG: hypothetical protein GY720_09500 [bacterium]|nr:hypothetical protein [bacterium]
MMLTEQLSRYAIHIDGSGHPIAEVGGKGAGLDWLVGHGYPVPRAIVITTAAYNESVAERSLRALITSLRESALPQADRIEAETTAIERAFVEAPIPGPVSLAVVEVGGDLLRQGPVAVRSSATAEDLAGASFAGQHLTVTNVADVNQLELAIRRCWASLWMPAARAYRQRQGVTDKDVAMAVVVQRMVEPVWSGVTFTRDPQGRNHLMRIEAVEGLGEDLVSGRVTPADYLVRRDTLEVVQAQDQERLGFLEDLARLCLRIERSGHSAQDIEWAYVDSGLTVLQSRPITDPAPANLDDGLDTSTPAAVTFTPHGVVEMLPDVVPPLLWTINAPMLENAFRATFANLGGATPSNDRMIVNRFRGRVALDLSAICDIARSMPGGTPAEVERQYLGETIGEAPEEPTRSRGHVFAAMRIRRAHNSISDEVDLIAAASPALARMQLDLTELPVRLLVAYRQRIRDLAWRGYAAEVGASSAAGAAYRALEILLERWLPEAEAASWAQILTRGALQHSAVGSARARVLEEVLDSHPSSDIADIVQEPGVVTRTLLGALGAEGEAFLADVDNAVRSMGSKAVYGGPAWIEDDWWIWQQLRMMSRGETRPLPTDLSWAEHFERLSGQLSSEKRWRRTRLLTGQVVDLRLRWLRRQVEETVRFLSLRERAKNALLVLGGEERRILLESANRLVSSRDFTQPDLVNYLTDAELEEMLFGGVGVDSKHLEVRRAIASEAAAADPLPDWFVGHPDTVPHPQILQSDRLEGWAASPGSVTGTVRIVSSLADGVRLEPGDIMVAYATDPSWTPLFLVAGAIVLEVGGPLCHAAIVAREFGLPAVLNVRQASRRLVDGETVTIDGSLGVVERLGQGGSA